MAEQRVVYRAEWPIATILFIVFLVLKLVGVTDWSWWWVTAPLWLPIAAILITLVVVGAIVGLIKLFT